MQLTIIAKVEAKPGLEDQLYQALRRLVLPTRAEAGCINYDLHRSIEHPGLFVFYENWTNRELWEAHIQSDHFKAFQQTTEDTIAHSELLLLTPDVNE